MVEDLSERRANNLGMHRKAINQHMDRWAELADRILSTLSSTASARNSNKMKSLNVAISSELDAVSVNFTTSSAAADALLGIAGEMESLVLRVGAEASSTLSEELFDVILADYRQWAKQLDKAAVLFCKSPSFRSLFAMVGRG